MANVDGDGMLVNFTISETATGAQPKFKGGRWKDRLKAKQSLRLSKTKASLTATESDSHVKDIVTSKATVREDGADQSERTSKRRRLSKDGPASKSGASHTHKSNKTTSGPGKEPRGGVMSSLFTSNPTSRTADAPKEEPTGPVAPSNAPLDGRLKFTALGVSKLLSICLRDRLELKAPTAIQKVAVPQLLNEDRDAFVQAETGSGKTLAYLLPILQRIIDSSTHTEKQNDHMENAKIHRDSGLFAIILAPTRELCRQIHTVLENLLRCAHWLVCGAVIGGEKKKSEKARIRKGLNILVATPGRLADHLDNTKVLDVSNVSWLVLDEGDRLMEMGFEADIEKIVCKLKTQGNMPRASHAVRRGLPARRVTIMCSATMKMGAQRLGELSLKDAVHLEADHTDTDGAAVGKKDATDDGVFSAPAQLKQSYAVVPAKLRLVTLTAVLRRAFHRRGSVMKCIVFISCADSVDYHFNLFARQEAEGALDAETELGIGKPSDDSKETPPGTVSKASTLSTGDNVVKVYRLHGSLQQQVRTSTLGTFSRSKEPSVMICTDVASRGLDLPNIDFVIEYDPPFGKDDHVHRVGRTARAGRAGRTLIFLLPGPEEGYVDVLKSVHNTGGGSVSRANESELLRKGFGSTGLGAGGDWEARATDWQLDAERWVLNDKTASGMAKRAFQSHMRAYATHVAAERHIFDIKALHLGHLAKSFGLRDPPGRMNVAGMRAAAGTREKGARRTKRKADEGVDGADSDAGRPQAPPAQDADAVARMRKKMREHMVAASEFNIG